MKDQASGLDEVIDTFADIRRQLEVTILEGFTRLLTILGQFICCKRG